ncbi:MAG: stage II sporulation protein M [Chloroflexota bacterium]|nr:stage II sporulation protein M [Chloroflexota bacterium]
MLRDALIVTRREVRDSLRDWRIVAPILILTLIFPWIMNFSTRLAINFVEQYNATIIPLRLVPFATMVVGFFPISFSLIIALESFVGEKERNSLEPLLATPISDGALYLGKLLSSMIPPLFASYLGIGAYLLGLFLSIQFVPEWVVLIQILLLTTMESVVMVAGAVVVSSHTTSVRAANLLASFVIIPMAFLLQGESVLLFWGQYDVLWAIIAALVVAVALLIRTGMRTFNREEILAGEIDELNLGAMARLFRQYFFGGKRFSLVRLYREEVPRLVRENRLPIMVTVIVVVGGVIFGWLLALRYPLPGRTIDFHIDRQTFEQQLVTPGYDFLPRIDTEGIFWNNVRSLALASLVGLFSFGSLGLLLLAVPIAIVGFFAGQVAAFGMDPLTFFAAFILPHGIFELPAAILATAFALRLGASIIAPPAGVSAGENLLHALADLVKMFIFVVIPLLLIAAWVEANVTPQVVLWFYGR